MARRSQPAAKRPAELTPAQLQAGIDRLGKLVERITRFDPQSVIKQHNIPHVQQLSAGNRRRARSYLRAGDFGI